MSQNNFNKSDNNNFKWNWHKWMAHSAFETKIEFFVTYF